MMKTTELLRALKYTDEEIKTEKNRVDQALTKCKIIKDEDIDKALSNLKKYLTTEAARKMLGIALKRFTDMMLAKDEGKKLVYLIHEEMPQIILTFYGSMGREKLCIEIPETIMLSLFGQTCFDKTAELLEYGEKHGMDITAAHCPVDKVALGAVGEGVIPRPDFITSGGVWCDQGPKQCEVMGEIFNIPYFLSTDSLRDEPWRYFPEIDEDNAIYLGETMERHFRDIAKQLGTELTMEHFRNARVEVAKIWFQLMEVHKLISEADPRPISATDDELFYWMTGYPDWRVAEMNEAYRLLIAEIKDKIAKGEGVVPKGALRTNFSCDSRPDIYRMCEKELGLNIVLPGTMFWIAPFERMRKFSKETNEFVRFAEAYMKRGFIRCSAWDQVVRAAELAKHFKLDGYMVATEYGCRPLCWFGHWVKDEVEKEAGIPVIYYEHSIDPRTHTPEQMSTKIETFASMMKIRKAAKERVAASSSN